MTVSARMTSLVTAVACIPAGVRNVMFTENVIQIFCRLWLMPQSVKLE